MGLHPLTEYAQLGEELSALNPNAYGKIAFISSEDPTVFENAKKITWISPTQTTSTMVWQWYASKIKRLNSGPFEQLDAFGNRSLTTLSWMSDFMIAMECDAFIGTFITVPIRLRSLLMQVETGTRFVISLNFVSIYCLNLMARLQWFELEPISGRATLFVFLYLYLRTVDLRS